jgi:L-methionine (R)-S-oxide reductase
MINFDYRTIKMAEDLTITRNTSKEDQYQSIIPQIEALLYGETDFIANLANVAAALKEQFNWFWVGFYLVKEDELVLGPFQGPVACTRIKKGKGVCGASWAEAQTIIVPDVEEFPGHIACATASKSEIVLPLIVDGEVIGVLDVDSEVLNKFDETDKTYLEQVILILLNR